MDELRTVLVGLDFSTCSVAALGQAARMASDAGAVLQVFHAIPRLVVTDLAETIGRETAALEVELIADARAQLSKLVEAKTSKPVEVEVVVGAPLDEMLEAVERHKADLLVLGVSGVNGRSVGAGTFALKCVRRARTKVLLVHEEHAAAFRRVVACVDFSKTSERALAQAVAVAKRDKSDLHVVHVYYGPWHRLHYRSPTPEASPAFQRQYLKRLEGLLDGLVEPFASQIAELTCCRELYEHQSYGRGIVEYLLAKEADLVVLGTEGNTNLRYVLLGSTAERVLRETPCSVLTIKPLKYSQPED